jgi:hypothetical protein
MQITGIVPPMRGHNDFHVVPNGNAWAISQENNPMFRQMRNTQVEAIGYAIDLARNEAVSLIVHGTDGRFREVYNYSKKG